VLRFILSKGRPRSGKKRSIPFFKNRTHNILYL
jgi:hypothetical protein